MGKFIEFTKAVSMLDVKFQKARALPGSIFKALAQLGLKKSGLIPPQAQKSFLE